MTSAPRSSPSRSLLAVAGTLAITALLVVVVPVGLLRPFTPQSELGLSLAFSLRRLSPVLTLVMLAVVIALVARSWRAAGKWRRVVAVVAALVAGASAWFARQNHFQWMFAPIVAPGWSAPATASWMRDSDLVLTVRHGAETVAIPVRQIAYHHLLNDVAGGLPYVATFCTLCHTGIVWDRRVDGRTLTFELAGINNQNFLMRDRETGSWWQQMSGRAVRGPLAGRALERVASDEVSWRQWRAEIATARPRVLRPVADTTWLAFSRDWEAETQKYPVRIDVPLDSQIPPRTVVLGVTSGGAARAYPFDAVRRQAPLVDVVGTTPVVLVIAGDGLSVRAFASQLDGRRLEFVKPDVAGDTALVDVETGTAWNFEGRALSGPMAGRQLDRVQLTKNYWFNWLRYNPGTSLYHLGSTR